jgi:hypothetical protein
MKKQIGWDTMVQCSSMECVVSTGYTVQIPFPWKLFWPVVGSVIRRLLPSLQLSAILGSTQLLWAITPIMQQPVSSKESEEKLCWAAPTQIRKLWGAVLFLRHPLSCLQLSHAYILFTPSLCFHSSVSTIKDMHNNFYVNICSGEPCLQPSEKQKYLPQWEGEIRGSLPKVVSLKLI